MEFRVQLINKLDRVLLDYVQVSQVNLGCSRIAHYPLRPKEYLEPMELIIEDSKGKLELFNNWLRSVVSGKDEVFEDLPYSVVIWTRDFSNQIFRKFVYNIVKLISIDYGTLNYDSNNYNHEKHKFKVIISYEKLDVITIQEEEWK